MYVFFPWEKVLCGMWNVWRYISAFAFCIFCRYSLQDPRKNQSWVNLMLSNNLLFAKNYMSDYLKLYSMNLVNTSLVITKICLENISELKKLWIFSVCLFYYWQWKRIKFPVRWVNHMLVGQWVTASKSETSFEGTVMSWCPQRAPLRNVMVDELL